MAESETALQAFDYTVLPANMCTVIRANTEEFTLHMNRSVQEYGQACVNVMNVHAALADRYSGRWAQWCQSVGLSIRSATRMVEVGSNVMGSAKLAELVQDGQIGKSLLQAICAPSAEPEAVDQVLSGDITTHKEYQELLAQLKDEKERGAAAEAREEEVWKMHEEAKQRAETAESRYKAALADVPHHGAHGPDGVRAIFRPSAAAPAGWHGGRRGAGGPRAGVRHHGERGEEEHLQPPLPERDGKGMLPAGVLRPGQRGRRTGGAGHDGL